MQASIEQLGSDIFCRSPQAQPTELRLAAAAADPLLRDWSARYAKAVRTGDPVDLLAIGREIFDWLDASGWTSGWTSSATGWPTWPTGSRCCRTARCCGRSS